MFIFIIIIMLLSILTFHTYVVVNSVLKTYKSDPLSVIYGRKGLIPEMVLKQCPGFGGHSLEGSKRGCLGFLKKFCSISFPKWLKFRIGTRFKVPEINFRFFLRLGSLPGVSRAFPGFRGLFPDPDIRIGWNLVRIQNVRFLRWI